MVEELPSYEPCGQGPHLYVTLRREGETTQSLRKRLAEAYGVRPDDVGYAGLKDKHARATQTFSVLQEDESVSPPSDLAAHLPGVELLCEPRRHRNKLKPGHLRGNRFSVTVRGLAPGAGDRAAAVIDALTPSGWPNYFGPQRQGVHGDNAAQGLAMLRGDRIGRGRPKPWLRKLLLSAWQSERFDAWLAARIRAGEFDTFVPGDIVQKTDTGGIFDIPGQAGGSSEFEAEVARLRDHAVTYTGPMFGFKMRAPAPGTPAAAAEAAVLAAADLPADALRRSRLPGTRRPARLHPTEFSVSSASPGDPESSALTLTFGLPKGAYATTVLREIMKTRDPDPASPVG